MIDTSILEKGINERKRRTLRMRKTIVQEIRETDDKCLEVILLSPTRGKTLEQSFLYLKFYDILNIKYYNIISKFYNDNNIIIINIIIKYINYNFTIIYLLNKMMGFAFQLGF